MKNILITGASQGIGKATAIEAAKAKMFVGINYNQNLKAAEECLKLVRDLGGNGIILKCDVAINKSVKDMFNEFLDKVLLDYQNYKNHIVKQENNKEKEMKLIYDYLEKIRKENGLSEEMVNKAKFQQQKIVKKMNNVRNDLSSLLKNK